ncbi:hypothetical protein JCM16358_10820 [Halanaerocella petrolearia]
MFSKKSISIMLIFVLLVGVTIIATGCGGSQSETSNKNAKNNNKSKDEEVKLKLWSWYGMQRDGIEKVIKAFEEKYPNVKIEWQIYESGPYVQNLKTSFIGGDGPDIFGAEPSSAAKGILKYIKADRVMDLTEVYQDRDWNDRFYSSAIKQLTFNDKIYSVPVTVNNVNLYYNKKIFNKYNLESPTTFEELITVSKELRNNGIIPITWGNKWKWTGKDYFYQFVGQFGTNLLQQADRGKVKFTDEQFIKALKAIKELKDNKVFAEGINSMGDWDAIQLLFQSKAAMYFSGTWAIPNIQKNAPEEFLAKLGLIQFPVMEGNLEHVSPGGVGMNYAVNKRTEHPEWAIKFLDFYTKTKQQKIFAQTTQLTSANPDANTTDVANSKLLQMFNNYQGDICPRTLYSGELSNVLANQIQSFIAGDISAKEALQKVEAARE